MVLYCSWVRVNFSIMFADRITLSEYSVGDMANTGESEKLIGIEGDKALVTLVRVKLASYER